MIDTGRPLDPLADGAYQPRTELNLFWGVELTPSYEHSFDFFKTVEEQVAFFKGRYATTTIEQFNYIRERSTIRVNIVYEQLLGINYICFKNSNHTDNFWMFGFVTQINYINHDACEIVFEVDVLQTYMFRYELRPSFIERETVRNDGLFVNLIDEHLDLGPIKTRETFYLNLAQSMVIVIAYYFINGPAGTTKGALIDGVYTGLQYDWFGTTPDQIERVNNLIETLAEAGYLDNIISIFMVPASFVTGGNPPGVSIDYTPRDIDGYVPKNNKLFCYPFNYLAATNNQGTHQLYRYEQFKSTNDIFFVCDTVYNMETSCYCYPNNYAGEIANRDMGLVIDNFPVCSWVGNVYANWFARNKQQVTTQAINLGLSTVTGVAKSMFSGNLLGLPTSFNALNAFMAQIGDREMFPYQLKGAVNTSVGSVKWQTLGYRFMEKEITYSYAERIDKYFSMFGYQVSKIATPSHNHRIHWDYVKTQGLNVIGRFQQEHVEKLKSIFNNGITFWHDSNIMFYDQDNPSVGVG